MIRNQSQWQQIEVAEVDRYNTAFDRDSYAAPELIRCLIDHGTCLDARNKNGATPWIGRGNSIVTNASPRCWRWRHERRAIANAISARPPESRTVDAAAEVERFEREPDAAAFELNNAQRVLARPMAFPVGRV